MASSYPPPFEGTGEVKEGFLCPLCLKDLQSFYQLQDHYEEEHSGDDRHVRGQLKSESTAHTVLLKCPGLNPAMFSELQKIRRRSGVNEESRLEFFENTSIFSNSLKYTFLPFIDVGLVQKAKKAKDKFLKKDGEDRPETGSYESFYYGGVDPYMWEPQELGEPGSLPRGGGHRGVGGLSIGFPFNGQSPSNINTSTLFLGKSSFLNSFSVFSSFLFLIILHSQVHSHVTWTPLQTTPLHV